MPLILFDHFYSVLRSFFVPHSADVERFFWTEKDVYWLKKTGAPAPEISFQNYPLQLPSSRQFYCSSDSGSFWFKLVGYDSSFGTKNCRKIFAKVFAINFYRNQYAKIFSDQPNFLSIQNWTINAQTALF